MPSVNQIYWFHDAGHGSMLLYVVSNLLQFDLSATHDSEIVKFIAAFRQRTAARETNTHLK